MICKWEFLFWQQNLKAVHLLFEVQLGPMQIFVKHPSTNQTLLFDCSPETTIAEFQEWVLDRILWPPSAYYVTHGRRFVSTQEPEATFAGLGVQQENTLSLIGRAIQKQS